MIQMCRCCGTAAVVGAAVEFDDVVLAIGAEEEGAM